MLIKEVRNAFFHSDYTIHENTFRICHGDGVRVENLIDPRVEFSWLLPRLELGINTALAVIQLVFESIRSYKENKIVNGRLEGEDPVPVQLLVSPGHGLVGFQCPPT